MFFKTGATRVDWEEGLKISKMELMPPSVMRPTSTDSNSSMVRHPGGLRVSRLVSLCLPFLCRRRPAIGCCALFLKPRRVLFVENSFEDSSVKDIDVVVTMLQRGARNVYIWSARTKYPYPVQDKPLGNRRVHVPGRIWVAQRVWQKLMHHCHKFRRHGVVIQELFLDQISLRQLVLNERPPLSTPRPQLFPAHLDDSRMLSFKMGQEGLTLKMGQEGLTQHPRHKAKTHPNRHRHRYCRVRVACEQGLLTLLKLLQIRPPLWHVDPGCPKTHQRKRALLTLLRA